MLSGLVLFIWYYGVVNSVVIVTSLSIVWINCLVVFGVWLCGACWLVTGACCL